MIAGAARRLGVSRWGLREWATATLAGVLIASLPLALSGARWLRFDGPLWGAAGGGAVIGLLAALRLRRAGAAHLLIVLGGAMIIAQIESRALPPLWPALGEIGALARWAGAESAAWVIDAATPREENSPPAAHPTTPPPAMPEWQAAAERLALYGWNLSAGLPAQIEPGKWGSGQALIASALGLLVWVVSGHAAWRLARRASAWSALLAVITPLAASVYLSTEGWAVLLLAAGAGLMLAGASALIRIERRWPPAALYDYLWQEWWAGAGLIAAFTALAMGVTVVLTDPALQQRIDRLVPSVNVIRSAGGRAARAGERRVTGVWPRQHLLASGPELSRQPAMTVRTPGAPQGNFYWRAASYDDYTGRGWLRHTASREQSALWPEDEAAPPGAAALRQTYRLSFDTRTIYAAGRLVRLTQSAAGLWRDPSGFDLTGVESYAPVRAYEALSWVPAATPDELRAAQGDMPEWVMDVYLALPEELPPRVAVLAQEITAGAPTAYDRAIALQDYLRAYPYSLELPEPPRDRDVVDYFLFDLERGYCDYYASAMVVMARSVGLPARLAVGYRTGNYDPETDAYFVTQADAHSWVEIYFPTYGWIPFEPTGGVPRIEHGLGQNWQTAPLPEPDAAPQWNTTTAVQRRAIHIPEYVLWLLAGGAGVMVVLAGRPFAMRSFQQRRWRAMSPDQLTLALYGALRGEARRLGAPLADWQTPHEMVPALMETLALRAQHAPRWSGNWTARLPEIRRRAQDLVSLYAESRYSPRPASAEAAQRALDGWPWLARSLYAFRWIGWLPRMRSQR